MSEPQTEYKVGETALVVVPEDKIEIVSREIMQAAEADRWQVRPNMGLELQHFARVCIETGLSPVLKEIFWINTKNGPGPYVGKAGLLKIAHRAGDLTGIVSRPLNDRERSEERIGDDEFAYYATVTTTIGAIGFTALGVANPRNCKNPDLRGMARKRAECAALRLAYSVGIASVEEVEGWDDEQPAPRTTMRILGQPAQIAAPAEPPSFDSLDLAGKLQRLWEFVASKYSGGQPLKGLPEAALVEVKRQAVHRINLQLTQLGVAQIEKISQLTDEGVVTAVWRMLQEDGGDTSVDVMTGEIVEAEAA